MENNWPKTAAVRGGWTKLHNHGFVLYTVAILLARSNQGKCNGGRSHVLKLEVHTKLLSRYSQAKKSEVNFRIDL